MPSYRMECLQVEPGAVLDTPQNFIQTRAMCVNNQWVLTEVQPDSGNGLLPDLSIQDASLIYGAMLFLVAVAYVLKKAEDSIND